MFTSVDKIHLANITKLLAHNVKFNNLGVKEISEAYHSLSFLQEMGKKIDLAIAAHQDVSDFSETLKKETENLVNYIEELKAEIEELKKPKRPRRKKR